VISVVFEEDDEQVLVDDDDGQLESGIIDASNRRQRFTDSGSQLRYFSADHHPAGMRGNGNDFYCLRVVCASQSNRYAKELHSNLVVIV